MTSLTLIPTKSDHGFVFASLFAPCRDLFAKLIRMKIRPYATANNIYLFIYFVQYAHTHLSSLSLNLIGKIPFPFEICVARTQSILNCEPVPVIFILHSLATHHTARATFIDWPFGLANSIFHLQYSSRNENISIYRCPSTRLHAIKLNKIYNRLLVPSCLITSIFMCMTYIHVAWVRPFQLREHSYMIRQ